MIATKCGAVVAMMVPVATKKGSRGEAAAPEGRYSRSAIFLDSLPPFRLS